MSDDRRLLTHTLVSAAPTLATTVIILVAVYWLRPSIGALVMAVCAWIAGVDGWKTWHGKLSLDPSRPIYEMLWATAFILCLYILNWVLGPYGFLGLLIIAVVTAVYFLWRRWGVYMWWVRHIERRFFGGTMEERRQKK